MIQNSLKYSLLLSVFITSLTADYKRHYVAMGTMITVANTETIKKDRIFDASFRYGYMINRYLDLEAMGTLQLLDNMDVEHAFSYGLYLKPNYNITKETNLYTLIGYSKNSLIKNSKNFTNNETIQYDFSYGVGVEFEYADDKSIYVDYISHIDKSTTQKEGKYSIKLDSISMGLKYNFAL